MTVMVILSGGMVLGSPAGGDEGAEIGETTLKCFERGEIKIIPAPVNYILGKEPLNILDFLPNAGALNNNFYAIHEWIGLMYYSLGFR